MRFSKRSLYAVRAMVRLAIQYEDCPVSIREISEIEDISFRNKTYGYHSGTMRIQFKNGKTYYGRSETYFPSRIHQPYR